MQTDEAATLQRQILRFGLVGIVGFIVNAGMVEWLSVSIGPLWAQLFSFPCAATVTWWLNRRYTFGASRHVWHREWMRYVTANALGWAANNGMYLTLILKFSLAFHHPALAVAAGSLADMILNFGISKWVVFR